MNSLEVEFLFRINFSLHVTPELYNKYHSELVTHAVAADGRMPASPDAVSVVPPSPPMPPQQPTHNMMGVDGSTWNNINVAPGYPHQQQQYQPQMMQQQQQFYHQEPPKPNNNYPHNNNPFANPNIPCAFPTNGGGRVSGAVA